jgi:hypothetical protein
VQDTRLVYVKEEEIISKFMDVYDIVKAKSQELMEKVVEYE